MADDAEKVEFSIDTTNVVYDNVKAFLWDKNMKPLGLETTIKKEEKPVVTPPPTEAPSDGNYTWKFDSFNEFSSSPVQNAPYKTEIPYTVPLIKTFSLATAVWQWILTLHIQMKR